MKKNFIFIFILIFILFFYIIKSPLKIGIIGNFSGDETFSMEDIVKAVNTFSKKYKYSNIKIYYEDAKGNAEDSLKVYNKLKKKNVSIMIFATDSTSFNPVYPLLKKDKILGIGASITSDIYTNKDDWFVRIIPNNKNEQKQIAEYLNEKTDEILIIKGYENPIYINNSFENFKDFYYGNINLIPLNTPENSIEKIKLYYNNENYAYIMISSINKSALIINLLKKMNPKINIIILPWFNDKHLIDLLDNKKNIILPYYFSNYSEYSRKFKELYNEYPNIYANIIYETLEILYYAYKNTPNRSEEIKKYLLNNTFNTSFGIVKFDKYGEINKKLLFEVYPQ
ncbi:ABC transporter substrate-binding protein [Marinitoga sp. 1155]|uniref:ABC transporter substrate-binding protein n=1 Tax=Marinitoga sp. 1155 TaxID=1428448 RepID=UPI0006414C58|nr:ABC transporter substrate-binding protein [Marinitoga sp. 1155]KLO22269.1 hypothetical protein X274_08980 [Marinitoga sp. 1155]